MDKNADIVSQISTDNMDNRFLFVMIAAKRALQLQKGAKPRVEMPSRKPTVLAMTEAMEEKVDFEAPNLPKDKKEKTRK